MAAGAGWTAVADRFLAKLDYQMIDRERLGREILFIPRPLGNRSLIVEKVALDAPKKLLTPAKVGYTLNLAIQRGQVALCNQMCPSTVSSIKLMSEWLLWCSGCVWMRRNGEWRAPVSPGLNAHPVRHGFHFITCNDALKFLRLGHTGRV